MPSTTFEQREGKTIFRYSPNLQVCGTADEVREYCNLGSAQHLYSKFERAVVNEVHNAMPLFLQGTVGTIQTGRTGDNKSKLRYGIPNGEGSLYVDIQLHHGLDSFPSEIELVNFKGGELEGVVNYGLCAEIPSEERVGLEIIVGALIHGNQLGYFGERSSQSYGYGSLWTQYPSVFTGGADWTILSRVENPTRDRMDRVNTYVDEMELFFDQFRPEIKKIIGLLGAYRDFRINYISPLVEKKKDLEILWKKAKEAEQNFPAFEIPLMDEISTFSTSLREANTLLDNIRHFFPQEIQSYLFAGLGA